MLCPWYQVVTAYFVRGSDYLTSAVFSRKSGLIGILGSAENVKKWAKIHKNRSISMLICGRTIQDRRNLIWYSESSDHSLSGYMRLLFGYFQSFTLKIDIKVSQLFNDVNFDELVSSQWHSTFNYSLTFHLIHIKLYIFGKLRVHRVQLMRSRSEIL